MKKIKAVLIALFVCALGYGGYSAYDYVTMTDAERFMLSNIEALTWDEPGGGSGGANETCYRSTQYHSTQRTPICIGNGLCRYQEKCMYVLGTNGESCTVTLQLN